MNRRQPRLGQHSQTTASMTCDPHYFQYLRTRSRWGVLYRRWWLYPRLASRLRGRALDIGCGLGDMLAYRPNTVGVDVNADSVRHCSTLGLDARRMLPDALPFDDASYDCAILDHIEHPKPLLAEVRRVIRPGGVLLVGVPGTKGWACDADHKVFYGEHELRVVVEAAGFRCAEMFFSPLTRSRWLDRSLRLYAVWGQFHRA
jgi:SAM-dependent methyltransferase